MTFTPYQLALAMGETNAKEAGFIALADSFAAILRKDLGQIEDTHPSVKTLPQQGNSLPRRHYESFKLTEADECALEAVESPERSVS